MKRSSASTSSAPAKKPKLPVNFGSSEPNPCSTKQEAVQKLKEWFSAAEFYGNKSLEFDISESCGNSLGCFSKKSFKAGEVLFTVPANCMVSVRQVAASAVVQFVLSALKTLNKIDTVTLEFCFWMSLIEAKSDVSNTFHVYLDSLADESPNVLSWQQEIQDLLQDTNLSSSLQSLKTSLQSYSSLLEEIRAQNSAEATKFIPSQSYNYSTLLWAAGHYLSRRYPFHFGNQNDSALPLELASLGREAGLGNIGTLVPCLDILNHNHEREYLNFEVTATDSRPAAKTDLVLKTGDLVVRTQTEITPGQELFSNYGTISNGQLMFAYGYALPNNPHDEFMLKVKVPPSVVQSLTENFSSSSVSLQQASSGLFALKRGGFHGIPKELFTVFKSMIRMSEQNEDEQDEEEGTAETGFVIDEECLDLLYSYLSSKLLRLHGLFVSSVRDTLKDRCSVQLDVPFPGGVRYEDDNDEDLNVPMILHAQPCTVTALPLSRHHGPEDMLKQQRGLCVAHYLAGQFEILLEVIKDLQNMMGNGEEGDGGEEEGDEDDDDEEAEDEE